MPHDRGSNLVKGTDFHLTFLMLEVIKWLPLQQSPYRLQCMLDQDFYILAKVPGEQHPVAWGRKRCQLPLPAKKRLGSGCNEAALTSTLQEVI